LRSIQSPFAEALNRIYQIFTYVRIDRFKNKVRLGDCYLFQPIKPACFLYATTIRSLKFSFTFIQLFLTIIGTSSGKIKHMSSYQNAMELLVEEEVKQQVKALPKRVAAYINQVELVAYALNQLPSLYATSEKGLEYQIQRGKAKFDAQIKQAVRQAIAAVGRDPIRACVPLQPPQQTASLRDILHQLRVLLKNDKVEWETLPKAVADALTQSNPNGINWDAHYETTMTYPGSHHTIPNSHPANAVQRRWTSNLKQSNPQSPESQSSVTDWDDPFHDVY
jgi:hypothetical protein